MEVKYTNSWASFDLEKECAEQLIADGCVLISQHADSMGAPTACEAAGVPNVSYNGSTVSACPNTFIVSSRIDWAPYLEYAIDCVKNGKAIDTDWTGTLSTGSVVLTDVNTKAAAEGTQAKIDEVKAELEKTNDVAAAAHLGTVIAKRAIEKGITTVVFDRGGFIYQGKIQALADAAREAGLNF